MIAKVDGEVWDLDRPFEKSSTLQLLKFDDEDAQVIYKVVSSYRMSKENSFD